MEKCQKPQGGFFDSHCRLLELFAGEEKPHDPIFDHFDTIRACVIEKDRQTTCHVCMANIQRSAYQAVLPRAVKSRYIVLVIYSPGVYDDNVGRRDD